MLPTHNRLFFPPPNQSLFHAIESMDLSWPVILDDIILYSHEDVADGISADSTTILGIRYNKKQTP